MIWLSGRFENRPLLVAAIRDRFEVIFIRSGAPPGMMLVAEYSSAGTAILWMHVDERWESTFRELQVANDPKLPRVATLLVGANADFEAQFQYGP